MTANEVGCACGFPDCMKLITDRETIRNSDDPDADRIIRRVHAALNSGTDRAVVAVVLDEIGKARGTAPDDELTRRLEWATGRNGATLLGQIRAEGLDVITVTKEDES